MQGGVFRIFQEPPETLGFVCFFGGGGGGGGSSTQTQNFSGNHLGKEHVLRVYGISKDFLHTK